MCNKNFVLKVKEVKICQMSLGYLFSSLALNEFTVLELITN